jgi:hypothetical protein
VHWDYAAGLEARYRFRKKDNDIKGLYALGTLGYEAWTISKPTTVAVVANTLQSETFPTWYSSVGAGYTVFPFKKSGFWIGAQYNVIFILNNTNTRSINGQAYNIKPIVPPSFTPNIYLGWRFKK